MTKGNVSGPPGRPTMSLAGGDLLQERRGSVLAQIGGKVGAMSLKFDIWRKFIDHLLNISAMPESDKAWIRDHVLRFDEPDKAVGARFCLNK